MEAGKRAPFGKNHESFIQYCQGMTELLADGWYGKPRSLAVQNAILNWAREVGRTQERRDRKEDANRPITIIQTTMSLPQDLPLDSPSDN
jgi:hypothetical protein